MKILPRNWVVASEKTKKDGFFDTKAIENVNKIWQRLPKAAEWPRAAS